ncbi:branched-chain amino acid ABC transporter permease [Pigmentiphaga litoralis]|jgi:branched-chain amino acid transport system permease protein|uniref:branched-chain amino acid ABC transporter permease n=1 Tax=Pigmentiphaga litoralis TaxID=516702 RepID=UPI001675586C|nr:branched-chain amino acid ABC transporter permease [Pigmentiphaga litoralis]GGX14823.1 branched-chain amino acid ABC transporter permease [Pigmentiphaga litoralis]
MTFDLIALQLFTGLALGAIYVLLAVGLSLIFGMLTVVNFAHGAFYMLGAYAGFFVAEKTGSFWLAMLLAPIIVAAIGMVCERWLIRPLYGRGIDYPLLLTFGLAYMMVEAVRMIFGRAGLPFDTPEILQGATNLGFADFPTYRLFVIGVVVALLVVLWFFIEKTSLGLIVRAGARDPVIVRVLGVDISKVWLIVFGVGTGIAALAGVLAAPLQGVSPDMGTSVLIVAFVVTVVGGMGSLTGAVVAGLLVGIAESMSVLFFPEAAKVSMFVIMAIVLLFRPQGLFGRAGLMT